MSNGGEDHMETTPDIQPSEQAGTPAHTTAQRILQKFIDEQIETYQKDRSRHKKWAFRLQAMTVSLAGVVTVLLGWKGASTEVEVYLGNFALLLGATVTVLSAYEAFFTPRAQWVREVLILARLRDLKKNIDFAISRSNDDPLTTNEIDFFKKQFDEIMALGLSSWLRLRGFDEQNMIAPQSGGANGLSTGIPSRGKDSGQQAASGTQ